MMTFKILLFMIIISTLTCQDLIGGSNNSTENKTSILSLNQTKAENSTKTNTAAANSTSDFRKGSIKDYIPKNIDVSNINEINKLLSEIDPINFEFSGEMIPDVKDLAEKTPCVGKLTEILSKMSKAEQIALYGSYRAAQNTKTADNIDRCFDPIFFRKTFRKINKGKF